MILSWLLTVSGVMTYYVVYDGPPDHPGRFVLRRYFQDLWDGRAWADPTPHVADSLADVRAALPAGLYRIGRHPGDGPQLCEIWV